MSETVDSRKVLRGRITLIAVVAAFLLPLIAASFLFEYYRGGPVPESSSNGELIWPAIPLESFSLQNTQTRAAINFDWLKKHWTLVYLSRDRCGEVCNQNIYHMRQIHKALGKEAHRVQRLTVSGEPDGILTFIGDEYPKLNLATGDRDNLNALYRQFDEAVRKLPAQAESFYLVDPLGNIMMRFSPELDPGKILKDVKRALRASKIG